MTEDTEKTSSRPKPQTDDDALNQAREDALTPDQKHEHYLEDLERLHRESQ